MMRQERPGSDTFRLPELRNAPGDPTPVRPAPGADPHTVDLRPVPRWSEAAAFYGLDDASLRQATRAADAANGWLALRRSAPELAPSADAVAAAVRAA